MTSASPNPRRRFLRYSLRGLLLLVAVVGVGLGWAIHEARKQGIAVAALTKGVHFGYADSNTRLTVLEKTRRLLGERSWRNVVAFYGKWSQITDKDLRHLHGLPYLLSLNLGETKVTDVGLVHLRRVPRLYFLRLDGTQVTDSGLANLQGLTQLGFLSLDETQVTDAGLLHLQGLTQLHSLSINGTRVTDAGAQTLQKALPNCQIVH